MGDEPRGYVPLGLARLSRSDRHYMRSFAATWPWWGPNVPQPAGPLPWGHIRVLHGEHLAVALDWTEPGEE